MTDYSEYFTHQKVVQIVHGLTIRYRLAIDGPTATVTHSELDESLPEHSVRVATVEDSLLIRSVEWVDRTGDLEAHVLDWLLGHIDLRAAKVRRGSRRYDEVWMEAWRRANPGRR